MIEFTIKTLDSINHEFSVDDETTVQQLKDKVKDELGIQPNLQRLIFCGRVLQDEKKLSEYDVHGKVMHLVQRAPPNTGSRQPSQPTQPATSNDRVHHEIRRIMALTGATGNEELPMSSPTEGRIRLVRKLVSEIKVKLNKLKGLSQVQDASGASTSSSEPNEYEVMDTDTIPETVSEEPEPDTVNEGPPETTRSQPTYRRTIRAMRSRQSRPRDLAVVFEALEDLNFEFTPLRRRYIGTLKNADHVEDIAETERVNSQRIIELTCDIMHSFAHAYHAISELHYQVGQRNPRLTSDAYRHPNPTQTHVNVFHHRPQAAHTNGMNGVNVANPLPVGTIFNTSASVQTDANELGNSDGTTPPSDQEQQPDEPSNRPRTFVIQADPVTYQLEIEARVPIALVNAAHDHVHQQNINGQANSQVPSADINEQGNDPQPRRIFGDFENQLFDDLPQGSGGVEVLMSMGDLGVPPPGVTVYNPRPSTLGGANVPAATAAPTNREVGESPEPNQPQPHFAEVFLAPFPWGNAPTADFLQNIVSTVIRQGLVPGLDQGPSDLNIQNLMDNNTQIQFQPFDGTQTLPTTQPRAPASDGATDQTSTPNQPTLGRPEIQVRRATAITRGQIASLGNLVYDRFLACNNVHARRYLQSRREVYQRLMQQRRQQESSADTSSPDEPSPTESSEERSQATGATVLNERASRFLEISPESEEPRPVPLPRQSESSTPPLRLYFPTPQRSVGRPSGSSVGGIASAPSAPTTSIAPSAPAATITPSGTAATIRPSGPAATITSSGPAATITSSGPAATIRPSGPTATITSSAPAATIAPTAPPANIVPTAAPATIAPAAPPATLASPIASTSNPGSAHQLPTLTVTSPPRSTVTCEGAVGVRSDGTVFPLHMKNEFLDVLEADRLSTMAETTAEVPHSDAYLSGMPLRKRRKLRHERPTPALYPFIAESINEAMNEAGAGSNESAATAASQLQESSLHAAFRERIREMASQRAATDGDYQRERHTSLLAFLQNADNTT